MQYIKVASHGLIKKDNKFLVTRRSAINDYQPLKWDIPGGTIEFQEKSENALIREISEETDLNVDIVKPIFIYDFASGPERHQFQIVYSCNYKSGEVVLNPKEHDEFKWLTLEEISKLPNIAFLDELIKFIKK